MPIKEREAADKMAVPTPIVAWTIMGAKQLGRISAKINLKVFTPASLADSMYSKFFYRHDLTSNYPGIGWN